MMVDETKFNLDAPSVPDEEPSEEAETVEEGEVKGTSEPVGQEVTDPVVEEEEPARIPYSRFEQVHERAVLAESELERMRNEAQEETPIVHQGDLPEEWVKFYGDNPASREAFSLYRNGIKKEFASMKEELISEMRRDEQAAESEAEETADEWATTMNDFAAKNNRKFSDAEETAILDVMDELTPKDNDGNYLISPIDYLPNAVELYDLRQAKSTTAKRESRRKATQLERANGEGEPAAEGTDSHFRPGDWQSWRNNPALRG